MSQSNNSISGACARVPACFCAAYHMECRCDMCLAAAEKTAAEKAAGEEAAVEKTAAEKVAAGSAAAEKTAAEKSAGAKATAKQPLRRL